MGVWKAKILSDHFNMVEQCAFCTATLEKVREGIYLFIFTIVSQRIKRGEKTPSSGGDSRHHRVSRIDEWTSVLMGK